MAHLSSLALRVHHLDAMVRFYSEAFHIQFHEVDTFGIPSQFGEMNGITLKFVPIRDGEDFDNYPIHQPGFVVPDVETVIALAVKYGGWQEGKLIRDGDKVRTAVRDPDGNTIELFSE
jgi:catechol 2,3-dioxygenase-like lactoylglutathione lyase family enzyme